MNIKKLSMGIVLALFLMSHVAIRAADWPQWRGPNRDGKAPAFQAPKEWPAELQRQWSVVVGAGDASPVLVAGKLYVHARQNDDEILICLDANNGTEKWRSAHPAPEIKGPPSSHPGPRSTPTVANGKVITLGAGGILTCTDGASGKVVWRKDEFARVPEFYTAMSPIVV
ncbi:PQQ-binding-like beta-propeller repeat protein, partial [candidate division KSB1 bacterium]|nr:PQQ-binding-like beta-propeller repeat protein [candidate division KSB1 bacterium]